MASSGTCEMKSKMVVVVSGSSLNLDGVYLKFPKC